MRTNWVGFCLFVVLFTHFGGKIHILIYSDSVSNGSLMLSGLLKHQHKGRVLLSASKMTRGSGSEKGRQRGDKAPSTLRFISLCCFPCFSDTLYSMKMDPWLNWKGLRWNAEGSYSWLRYSSPRYLRPSSRAAHWRKCMALWPRWLTTG